MAREARVTIILTAKNLTRAAIGEVRNAISGLRRAVTSLQGQLTGLGIALSAGGIAKWLVSVNSEYGRLLTQLETFEGSSAGARAVFRQLSDFAATTPSSITEVVQAYVTLRTAGITPTMESLRLFGDQASAMGRKLNDFAVAIRAATTGEFEPLKSFGVQMHVQGDKAIATFQGVRTVIGRDAQSIVRYLEGISKANFAGGMERESRTLGGALSNLMDAVESLGRTLGEAGLTDDVINLTRAITEFVERASAVDELRVQYLEFKGVLLTILDALRLTMHLFVAPVQIVWHGTRALAEIISGLFTGVLVPAAAMVDAITGGKHNFAGRLAGYSGNRFNASIGALKNTWRSFASVGEDFGESFARASLRDEELAAAIEKLNANRNRNRGSRGGGLSTKGGSTAPDSHFSPEAKTQSATDELIDSLRDRIAIERELIDLNEDRGGALSRLLTVEEEARALLAKGNLTLQQRLDVLRAIAQSKDARAAFGVMTGAEITKALDPQTGLLKPQAIGITTAASPLPDKVTGAAPITLDDLNFRQQIGKSITDAYGDAQKLDHLVAEMAAHTFVDFGNAIEDAFAAMSEGSIGAAQAFEGAMLGAVASVASAFAQYAMGKATLAFGEGLLGINPGGFAAAAKYTAAATTLFAVAGTLKGAARNATGGSGGSAATGKTNTLTGTSDKGEATLIIEGGLLDMSDPRQADALASALETLSGRRVTIKGRS